MTERTGKAGTAKAGRSASEEGSASLITKAAYARRIGVSGQYISKIVRQGKLPVEPGGMIDPEKADAILRALRHRGRDPFRKSVIPGGESTTAAGNYAEYQRHRSIQAEYKARLTQLEFEIASGDVVKKIRREDGAVHCRTRRTRRHPVDPETNRGIVGS